jgi:hypothetical protein
MSDELITVQLTVQQARALASSAHLIADEVADSNPEWNDYLDGGEPPALTSGILTLEIALSLVGAPS